MAKSKKRKKLSNDTTAEKPLEASPSADTEKQDADSSSPKNRKRKHATESIKPSHKAVFNGLILSISTLESKTDKSQPTESEYTNFKTLSSILKSHGAVIAPQVHKRVHYLICTLQAVENLTQRVRQALKRNVDVINVDWVRSCIENGERVAVGEYLLNDYAAVLIENKKTNDSKNSHNNTAAAAGLNVVYESDIPDEDAAGWSEPIELDCCCVCHENGDENCPWCVECNVNLAKRKE